MSEIQIQANCYLWFHNTYPELRGLLCYNLNNSKNRIDGNKNRSLGLQAGRSDLVFYYQSKAYHIEMKKPGEKQSKDQIKWQARIESQGFNYHIIDNLDDFMRLIRGVVG